MFLHASHSYVALRVSWRAPWLRLPSGFHVRPEPSSPDRKSGSWVQAPGFASTRRAPLSTSTARNMSLSLAPFRDWGSPSFTQLVVDTMRKHYPEELAESWDNVGLLVGNIDSKNGSEAASKNPVVMITNDMTFVVAEEAIKKGVSVIISYHPFIFTGLKAITADDPQQATLLRLASHGIAVYCPHTALDAAPSGINHWLAGATSANLPVASSKPVQPLANPPAGFADAGYGCELRFSSPVWLSQLLTNVRQNLAGPEGRIMVASPPGFIPLDRERLGTGGADLQVSSVAVCAGSGYSVLKDCDVDVLVTGEMTHHNALQMTQMGKVVVCVFHSNSERGFLAQELRPLLARELAQAVPGVQVIMSEEDRDPFRIVQF